MLSVSQTVLISEFFKDLAVAWISGTVFTYFLSDSTSDQKAYITTLSVLIAGVLLLFALKFATRKND